MSSHPRSCVCCGGPLDPNDLRFNYPLPDPVTELPDEEIKSRVAGGPHVFVVEGMGRFLRVLLPIALDDGRRVTFGVFVAVGSQAYEKAREAAGDGEKYLQLTYSGLLANAIEPWGNELLGAEVEVAVLDPRQMAYVVGSEHQALARVFQEQWPASDVLGARAG
ncbi:hypothetical protein GCM10009555_065910 [Acrocarpospora macrocephala]|uniref:DUF2199 domain-containing protein n=1 Tax=Acrocarpospora macrocephala TaxID=150177 RepID=A0A5M3WVH7_9ACTN|nr:DUF2199 domain-containing protein [Acrocarpospora macrocephala]GES13425.1 hypothetical protein Amac_070220 [Acrocarpospora macrocephala]